MSLRNAVLAALLEGEASGYDLAKSFDASVANFWTTTPQQLYRELERMDEAGLIQARLVEQERRPNKRMYSLTEAGVQALVEFTTECAKPPAIREELLVMVQAVDVGDVAAIRSSVAERREWAQAKLSRYERLRARLLDGTDEHAYFDEAERIGPYLTLLRGIAFEQENLRWAELTLGVIDRRAAAVPVRAAN
ncbi:PadR family transcriptional regulator [Nocardia sp. NPDC055049]